MVMADPEPVAKRPLAPEPVVNTVPSVIVTTAADSARTPALRPYLLLSSTDEELPVVAIAGRIKVRLPPLRT
jgi:hypothetical protein